MTKKKAFSIARDLSVRCDEAHVFAVKIGTGCLCDVVCKKFRKLIIEALQLYLDDDSPTKSKPEILSDKLRAKRTKANEKIIAEVLRRLSHEEKISVADDY